MEFGDARVGAEKEKYGILGKTVKIIKTPLARHRYAPENAKLTTSGGRHTATLRKFMLHGNTADEPLLVDYDVFIRKDPLATGFGNLTDVTWDRNSSNASRKFSFNLTAAAASIEELQYCSQIQLTPTAKLFLAVTPDPENECDMAIPTETPSLKRCRMSQKTSCRC